MVRHACEAVRHPYELSIILPEQDPDYSFSVPGVALDARPAIVICCGEEDEGGNGDGPGDEREGFSSSSGHGGRWAWGEGSEGFLGMC